MRGSMQVLAYNDGANERAEREDTFMQAFGFSDRKDRRRMRRMRKGHEYD